MAAPFRMSEAAALGLHAAAFLARVPRRAGESGRKGRLVPVREIAAALEASEAHLSKVLQRLARAGLVGSTRGPGGGFRLGRPAESITLLEVYEAIEGPLDGSGCLFDHEVCAGKGCICGDLISDVHERTRRRLAGTRLSELGHVFAGRAS